MAYRPRLFIHPTDNIDLPLETGRAIDITHPPSLHHLLTVLRAKPGDAVDVVLDGQCFATTIDTIKGGKLPTLTLKVTSCQPLPADTLPPVTVAVAILPDERWRWLLQKLTELGVRQIVPLLTDYGKVPAGHVGNKASRWQAIVEAAASQSEGLFVPQVFGPQTVTAYCGLAGDVQRFLLFERQLARQSLAAALAPLTKATTQSTIHATNPTPAETPKPVWLSVGPEAGWSPAELACFEAQHFTRVAVGQRILRSETAALAGLSVVVGHYTQADTI
jgi:16S rRNA (uracil1498-N3)-methyltransferase